MENITFESRESRFISDHRNDLLKLVAMITMFIDHLGHMGIVGMIVDQLTASGHVINYDWYSLFRTIGRIAFPIFAYQAALGYAKTSNLKKYLQRLIIFALISHIPYIMFSRDFVIHPLHFNVIFLLLIGVVAIMIFEQAKAWFRKGDLLSEVVSIAYFILLVMIVLMPQFLDGYLALHPIEASHDILFSIGKVDFSVDYSFALSYGTYGLLMILLFHAFKGRPLYIIGSYFALEWIGFYLTYVNYIYGHSAQWFGEQYTYLRSMAITPETEFLVKYDGGFGALKGLFFQMRSLLTLPFIILLERFYFRIKLNKFVGYWFYPLHILLIFLIALIMKQFL